MMVHERSDNMICGPVMPQGGVQALETMLFTLDIINHKLKLIPGVIIGAHILDDCDRDTYGLEMAVDFIKGSISNIDDAEYACNATAMRKVISGVVGAASSVTSVQVANLLRLFKIPQVSFFSTSPELSNKARFEYFTRTIPSDLHQVRAMVEIVKKLGWSYVSIIYEESSYGIKAFEELEALLARNGICIAVKEKLVKDSGVADERAYDEIVQKLLTKPRARGAIIFGSDQEVAGVMRAVERGNATGAFSWVGSDGWSARALVSDGNERAVEGTISVQPQANDVIGFKEYFLGLNVKNNRRNPWFVEFWEDHFQCRYPGSPKTPYNGQYERQCSGLERLTNKNTEFERQLQFVSDAVMAFAYAIRNVQYDLNRVTPSEQLRVIILASLTWLFARYPYPLYHLNSLIKRHSKSIDITKKCCGYCRGTFEIIINKKNKDGVVVSTPARKGGPNDFALFVKENYGSHKKNGKTHAEVMRVLGEEFSARKNRMNDRIRSPYVETACMVCPRGTLPDPTRTQCRPIPEAYLRPDSAWAIGAMSFSSVGILLTAFVCGVWAYHSSTPVVRASGRELSYVLLAGILMCYLVTFALVFRPTDILCSLQRFGTGFCFTVVYAALLTKTNRISRIFNASKHSAKRPILISPSSQLAICAALVSIQVLIVVVWMIVAPARAMFHYPTREDNMLVCDSYVDASYMIAFFYPIVLIVICTVYAVLTRKIPEAFNESKHIGFTMYTTCVIWLAFVPLYFGTASHVPLRITSMAVTISLSASVTLVCLFSPKLYIILIRPERNVRQSIMPVRYSQKPLALPHPSSNTTHIKKPNMDKGTQTDPSDFAKLSNGQTIVDKNGIEKEKLEVTKEKEKSNRREKDKSDRMKGEILKSNIVKTDNADKSALKEKGSL
ncbi:metabotropic glutamate receptor 4 6 7 8 [Danaus plexippus plexippus]|uniref:Metabotropic glutamate receptor 4 6 7 8 n=1 Tax=Danaus plexippus plexippus TaxID=278856 RepID=A0A212EHW5_DANPL|nr:metabotropic glutamate receptor 4 6 7 8 [Danaus plexippus plexippus]